MLDDRPAPHPPQFDLDGGRLCLDFANTLGVSSADRLPHPDALLAFAEQADLAPQAQLAAARAELRAQPDHGQAWLDHAKRLRQAIFGLFTAVVARRPPNAPDLAVLNDELAVALAHRCLVAVPDGGYTWGWQAEPFAAAHLLWPVVRSAAELLTSPERDQVRQCAADDCPWLFLDTSRNRSRQWCSMATCGNRAKARRYYGRRRRPEAVTA